MPSNLVVVASAGAGLLIGWALRSMVPRARNIAQRTVRSRNSTMSGSGSDDDGWITEEEEVCSYHRG